MMALGCGAGEMGIKYDKVHTDDMTQLEVREQGESVPLERERKRTLLTIGGTITWDKKLRLRHSVTGHYLAVVPAPQVYGDASPDMPWFEAIMVTDPSPATLFQCHTIVQQKDKDKGRILLEDC